MREFKDVIQEVRYELNISQSDFAKMLGVSKSTIAMWELGERKPSFEVLTMVADVMNLDIDYLTGKVDVKRKVMFDESGKPYVPIPDYDPDTMEIIDTINKITPEQKQAVLSLLRSFVK